jgi:hypothetical protein
MELSTDSVGIISCPAQGKLKMHVKTEITVKAFITYFLNE